MARAYKTEPQAPKNQSTAPQRWSTLDGDRTGFIRRCEKYAALTVPKVLLPEHVRQDSESVQYDWTSVGAQAVNHLVNKLGMALFNPGRPFFRLDAGPKLRKELATAKIPEEKLREVLVNGETEAIKVLDRRAVRPKVYDALRHLVVTGNVLIDFDDAENMRVIGLRNYVVKRSVSGKTQEVIVREHVMFDELEDDVKAACPHPDTAKVALLKWYRRSGKSWTMTQWVDNKQLPEPFNGKWTEETLPIHVLSWDLSDAHDYGTGLVEAYSGDFTAISVMAESELKSAILASEFRWLADPAGTTDVNDFKTSVNGDILPGRKDDLTLVHMTSTSALTEIANASEKIVRRLGAAFLLGSAMTRQAERVTAEELRQQAQELESSLGGVYSRLAVDLQLPMAVWLLADVGVEVNGTQLIPTIVTGLDALSRTADAQNLVLALQDLAGIALLPPEVQARLQLGAIITTLFAARGLIPTSYLKPEEQVQQEQAELQQQAQAAAAQQALVENGSKALANQAGASAPQGPAPA